MVGSVDWKNIFLHDLLVASLLNTAAPKLFIFTNHAVKHKKLQLIPKFALKYVKNKAKKSINWNNVMRHSEAGFKGFAPSCSNNSTRFVELVRPIFLLLDHFLRCPCDLSMEYIDTHTHTHTHTHTQSFLVSTMGQWEWWFSWFALYFFYRLNETLYLDLFTSVP